MKIKFLGTGAADWRRDKYEGNMYRRLSSSLIDGKLLIDPGPEVLDALKEFGIDISDIKYVLNTHRHPDHFNEGTLKMLEENGAVFADIEAGEEAEIEKYKISSFKANHGTCEDAKHFIIDDGESRLFYGLDSAWLMYDEVQAIKEKGVDFAVIDATIGNVEGDYRIFEHNNLAMVKEMKKTLDAYIEHFCISHMARTLHDEHNVLLEEMKEFNIIVAYDGDEYIF